MSASKQKVNSHTAPCILRSTSWRQQACAAQDSACRAESQCGRPVGPSDAPVARKWRCMHLQHPEGGQAHLQSILAHQAAHLQLPAGDLKRPAACLAFAEALASSGKTRRALEVLQAALEGGPTGEVSISAMHVLVAHCGCALP